MYKYNATGHRRLVPLPAHPALLGGGGCLCGACHRLWRGRRHGRRPVTHPTQPPPPALRSHLHPLCRPSSRTARGGRPPQGWRRGSPGVVLRGTMVAAKTGVNAYFSSPRLPFTVKDGANARV
jgi:hypothetical protein